MTATLFLVNAVAGAPTNSGKSTRQALSAALGGATAARPLGARSGVRPGTPTSTVAATSTTWTIHPHAGILDTQASATAGPYWYALDADVTGAVTAAHATWPRKDILWVRCDDPAESDGSTVPAVVFGYTAGTAAASPAAPATPARSMRLATISVPLSGGGAPTIVFDAPYLVAGATGLGGNATSSGAMVSMGDTAPLVADGTSTYKITLTMSAAYSTVPGDRVQIGVCRPNSVLVFAARDVILSGAWGNGQTLVVFDTPPAGSIIYSGSFQRVAGTGTCTTQSAQIMVEKIA